MTAVADADLDRIARWLGDRGHERAAFIPADASFLANCTAHMLSEVRALRAAEAALEELVRLKAPRDEELRLRQRRLCAIERDVAERDRVDRMREDYNRRKPHAWEAARAALAAARAARGAE